MEKICFLQQKKTRRSLSKSTHFKKLFIQSEATQVIDIIHIAQEVPQSKEDVIGLMFLRIAFSKP